VSASPQSEAEVAALVAAIVDPAATTIDRDGRIPRELIDQLAACGWFGWNVSPAYAGSGHDDNALGRRHALVGSACSAVRAVLTAHAMVCAAIERWGRDDQRVTWLPALARGHALGAFALTEPEHGSDASAIATSFNKDKDGDGYRISGRKCWITGGTVATVFVVFGRVGDSHAAALVPADSVGLSIRPSAQLHGFRGAMVADIDLDDVAVASAMMLGRPTATLSFVVAHALELGRLLVAWGAVGMIRTLLSLTLSHAATRRQFNARLLDHQLVQRRIADMTAGLRAATLLCESASRMRSAADPAGALEGVVAKYTATRAAREAAQSTVQILGASGLREGVAERFLRDSAVLELIEGSTEISQIIIARSAALAL
jgi:glutaryl-CoA dehydrogenase (non-decarboxylating)